VHEASALVTGATLAAARAVWSGEAEHALNIAGGLHHAMPGAASGFCVYNDPGVAIAWMLSQGVRRVAYVDVDVHHGDGVQAMFSGDPRVLTISLHESPRTLFPGTGYPHETGAEGTAVNVALPAGCGDAGWLRAFHAVVPPLLREFQPEVLVSQQGCDGHALDPLANLMLSVDGQRLTYAALHALAHETAGGRWVATGGGGYELVRVVPRAWTHLIAEAAGSPLDPGTLTPVSWHELVRLRTGEVPPLSMTDGRTAEFRDFADGYDPADAVDRAIVATRKAVFPYHGLDPQP
jgi:acetoin utilization protein AcuC